MAETYEQSIRGNVTYVDSRGERQKGVAEKSDDSSLTYWRQLEKYYDDIYQGQVEENNAYAAAATERTLSEIREKIDAINEQYGQTNRQLYQDYMSSRKNLPQQLAAQGMTGGLSESSRVRLDTGYQESLGRNERSRLSDIAALDAQGVQAGHENQASARQANAAAQKEYYNSLASLRDRQHQEELDRLSEAREERLIREERDWQEAVAQRDRDWAVSDAQRDRDWAVSDAQRDRDWALSDAQSEREREDLTSRAELLSASGDFSGYAALGYSEAEIARLEAAWEAMNPDTALGIRAVTGAYDAADVAEMPAALAQRYLNLLGCALNVNGKWDYDTEKAYREVFGKKSGRYSSYSGYSYSDASRESGTPASSSASKSIADVIGPLFRI